MNEEFEKWWEVNGSDNWVGKRWAYAAWEDRKDVINTLKAENEKLREAAEAFIKAYKPGWDHHGLDEYNALCAALDEK